MSFGCVVGGELLTYVGPLNVWGEARVEQKGASCRAKARGAFFPSCDFQAWTSKKFKKSKFEPGLPGC